MAKIRQKKQEWLSVRKYAEKMGKSRTQIYMNIRLEKIPVEKIRVAKFVNKVDAKQIILRKQIFWEEGKV